MMTLLEIAMGTSVWEKAAVSVVALLGELKGLTMLREFFLLKEGKFL